MFSLILFSLLSKSVCKQNFSITLTRLNLNEKRREVCNKVRSILALLAFIDHVTEHKTVAVSWGRGGGGGESESQQTRLLAKNNQEDGRKLATGLGLRT